jgi:hypothetical protein
MLDPRTFELSAFSNSELQVSMAVSGPCEISGFSISVLHAGTCTVTASQGGDSLYAPALEVSHTFLVDQISQEILFNSIPDRGITAPRTFSVAASATSGLQVILTARGQCSIDDRVVTIESWGVCVVTAEQAGNDVYQAAEPVVREFAVNGLVNRITIGSTPNRLVTSAPFSVSATATSGLTVSVRSVDEEVCVVDDSRRISIVDIGTCELEFSANGTAIYRPAELEFASFEVIRTTLVNKKVFFKSAFAGTPIVGVKVTWESLDGRYRSTTTTQTDAQGSITFKSIVGGQLNFYLSGDINVGDWQAKAANSMAFVGAGITSVFVLDAVTLHEVPIAKREIQLILEDGSPLIGARVQLYEYGEDGYLFNSCADFDGWMFWQLRNCKLSDYSNGAGFVNILSIDARELATSFIRVTYADGEVTFEDDYEIGNDLQQAFVVEQLPVVVMESIDSVVGLSQVTVVSVMARNSDGGPISGRLLTLTTSTSGASASCAGRKTTATTNSAGRATFKVCPIKTATWSVDGRSIVGSAGVRLTVQLTPAAPRALTATAKTRSVGLAWTTPATVNAGSVTDYVVQYRLQGSSTWITFRDGTSTSRKATVTGLTSGQIYEFRVAAKNKAGTGTWSVTVLRAAK